MIYVEAYPTSSTLLRLLEADVAIRKDRLTRRRMKSHVVHLLYEAQGH
jgi:hypothetical protein